VIVDVVEYGQELEGKCLIERLDESKLGRSRAMAPPPSPRVVWIPCPGKHCFGTGRPKWTGPGCRGLESHGFTDTYIYCPCSRLPASYSVFRCRIDKPRFEYAKHDPEHLGELLVDLDPAEVYNFLILGRTGAGKSMFINAFHNCVNLETLNYAMANEGPYKYERHPLRTMVCRRAKHCPVPAPTPRDTAACRLSFA